MYFSNNELWWLSRSTETPLIKACSTLLVLISKASPLDIKKVASFPVSIDPNLSSIPSIFAANSYCSLNQEVLGVLWIDAHADINTFNKSIAIY